MKRFNDIILSTVLSSLILFSGCVSWIAEGDLKKDGAYFPLKTSIPPYFDIERPAVNMNWGETQKKNDYSVKQFNFNSFTESFRKKNNRVIGSLYSPDKPKSKDVFLILPITGGNKPSDLISEILVSEGHYVISIKSGFRPMPKDLIKTLSQVDNPEKMLDLLAVFFKVSIRQNTVDLMRLLDYMENFTELKGGDDYNKPVNFHVIGLSLGGGIGSLLTVIDPRVHSLMTIISSASLARIILDSGASQSGPLAAFRDLLFKKFQIPYDAAYQMLSERLRDVEPLTYKDRIDPSRVLMVSGALDMMGVLDTAIPYSATYETWVAFGKPEWITLLMSGHVTSFFAFFPGWIEIQYPHHSIYNLRLDSHAEHLIKKHFLPKALGK